MPETGGKSKKNFAPAGWMRHGAKKWPENKLGDQPLTEGLVAKQEYSSYVEARREKRAERYVSAGIKLPIDSRRQRVYQNLCNDEKPRAFKAELHLLLEESREHVIRRRVDSVDPYPHRML